MNKKIILKILQDACQAPSGDNIQPWKFSVRENTIQVINAGDQTESIFNYKQMVNHVSLGACIENLRISAENHGIRADVHLFPDLNNSLIVAEVALVPDTAIHNSLASFIEKRTSNRKKYHSKEVEAEKLKEISLLDGDSKGRITFVSGVKVKEIAHLISTGEKIVLENKSIHDFLFKHVTWTKEEDAQKHGFFIDTFEFAPPQKVLFKLFSNWNILKWFIPLGFPDFVAKDMEKIYGTSSAFGAIVMSGKNSKDYVLAGMFFERCWLTATKLGLSLQPTTGLHFFAQPILENSHFELSEKTTSLITERYIALEQAYGITKDETIALAFRLGYADTPSASTTRFEPVVTFGE